MGLIRLIGCRLNGDTFSNCVEEKLRRERDDFAPVALEKRTSAAEAVKDCLFTARLKPCPSLDGLFPGLLGSPKASCAGQIGQFQNLILDRSEKTQTNGSDVHSTTHHRATLQDDC